MKDNKNEDLKGYYLLTKPNNGLQSFFFPFNQTKVSYHQPEIKRIRWRLLNNYSVHINLNLISKLKLLFKSLLKSSDLVYIHTGVIITDHYSSNYFHWLNDVLPKIQFLKRINFDEEILLPSSFDKYDYVCSVLKVYDLKYRYLNFKNIYFVNHLYKLNEISNPGGQHPILLKEGIKKILANSTRKFTIDNPDKIFISRRLSSNRRTLPLGEMESLLSEKGYHILEPETLSFNDQVQIFSNCKKLIAVHGAGMTNMIFMPRGSKVLEIKRKGDDKNYCYYFLASALEHEYYFFNAKGKEEVNFQNDDLYVLVDKFQMVLNDF